MTHRIREAMNAGDGVGPLGGEGKIVEADETYIGAEGGKKLGRPPVEKQVVFSLVERGGRVRSHPCPERPREHPARGHCGKRCTASRAS